jgi:methylated-DNA-protein-cysteine methyltransferase-like protein
MSLAPQDNHTKVDAILITLANIPMGKVSSYGDIAKRSGFPGLARYVAHILKSLPSDSQIPWYRVINSQGKISFPKDSTMYCLQREKLKEEGIFLSHSNTVAKKYFW